MIPDFYVMSLISDTIWKFSFIQIMYQKFYNSSHNVIDIFVCFCPVYD